MIFKENSIITLKNGRKYIISVEINYENKQYLLTNALDETKKVMVKEILIFQVDNNSVIPINDVDLLNKLIPLFKDKISN